MKYHTTCKRIMICLLFASTAASLQAGKYDDLVKAITRVGSTVDAPVIKSLDELFEQAMKKRGISIPKSSADEMVALRRLAKELEVTDPSVLKILDDLPPGQQRKLAAVLMDGADNVKKGIPDIRTRGQLMQLDEADDILVASSRHGDEFAREASVLRKAFDEGIIKAAPGRSAGTFADFTRIMSAPKSKKFWQFWKCEAVRNHWGKITAAGLVGWFLTDPHFFIDGMGFLTKRGMGAIRDLLGAGVAEAFRGLLKPTPGKELEYAFGLSIIIGLTYLYLARKRKWPPFRVKKAVEDENKDTLGRRGDGVTKEQGVLQDKSEEVQP